MSKKTIQSTTATTKGWGIIDEEGNEMWDADALFDGPITFVDRLELLFYPKKWVLYRAIKKYVADKKQVQLLDIGCGTGASVIDLHFFLEGKAKIEGIDVVQKQVDMAQERIKRKNIPVTVQVYDGQTLPYKDASIDIIYSSDVLGHVQDVPGWMDEIQRVLKPGGLIAMFSESTLGKHAYVRNFLLKKGINTDPHAEFHISLYSKQELQELFEKRGLNIEKMLSTVWAKFFVHPEELYPAMQKQKKKIPAILWMGNYILAKIKEKTHPFCAAIAELYSLVEMVTIGRWIESQGYVLLAKKSLDDSNIRSS